MTALLVLFLMLISPFLLVTFSAFLEAVICTVASPFPWVGDTLRSLRGIFADGDFPCHFLVGGDGQLVFGSGGRDGYEL